MRTTILLGLLLTAALALGPSFAGPLPPVPDEDGFVSIFDGKTLDGWDGDPRLWSVKDGVIHGETTAEAVADGNTFCVWRGGTMRDFILKIQFRLEGGNSGIQYRSKEMDRWRVTGYQAEVENTPGKVGFLYHEAGRGWLVDVGDFDVIGPDNTINKVSKVSDVEALKAADYYTSQDWNEYIIICQGNYIRHYLNGYPTMSLIDEGPLTDFNDPNDRNGFAREGLLALQIHAGDPMVVEFRNIRVKTLDADYGSAIRLFNGENLDGWELMSQDLAGSFGARDGVMTDSGTPEGFIRTADSYDSYTLHLQMRDVVPGNSGVLLRMADDNKTWPRSIECQGQSGSMGDVVDFEGFPMKVDPARTNGILTAKLNDSNELPTGEWNDYDLTLDGANLWVRVNNLLQNFATECEVMAGPIGFQSEGGQKEFRNIVLVPIEE
jgi:hypothetical protein